MNESKAIALSLATFALVVAVVFVGLTLLHASSGIQTATIVVIGCLGADLISRVVMRFEAVDQRRKREETLLR